MATKSRDQLIAKRADHQTNHVLHLILSIITIGFWIPVWLLVAISHANERGKIDRQLAKMDTDGLSAETPAGRQAEATESQRMPCPECAELIMPSAKRCRFCGAELTTK